METLPQYDKIKLWQSEHDPCRVAVYAACFLCTEVRNSMCKQWKWKGTPRNIPI